jgi:hypothetical protein
MPDNDCISVDFSFFSSVTASKELFNSSSLDSFSERDLERAAFSSTREFALELPRASISAARFFSAARSLRLISFMFD